MEPPQGLPVTVPGRVLRAFMKTFTESLDRAVILREVKVRDSHLCQKQ